MPDLPAHPNHACCDEADMTRTGSKGFSNIFNPTVWQLILCKQPVKLMCMNNFYNVIDSNNYYSTNKGSNGQIECCIICIE